MKIQKLFATFAIATVALFAACNEKEDMGVRPQVVSTNPISDATDVSLNQSITALFSEEMDASTNTKFTLSNGAEELAGTTTYGNLTVTFTPDENLLPNTVYTATIDESAMSALGSNMWESYSWDFTTGGIPDNMAPTLTLTSPEDNATNVALDQAIVFTFSEAIDASTLTDATFQLKQGDELISGEITKTEMTATFTPFAELDGNTSYTAMITTDVKDLAGNAIEAEQTITFTTIDVDNSLPRINAINPLDEATNVVQNASVSVTFNEEMDATTINNTSFTLKEGANSIAGSVSYNNTTQIATFNPETLLEGGLTYTATITTDAKDLAGNAIAANTVWSFTTAASSAPLDAVNLRSSANYVILAKSTITNVPTSAITGDMGLSPAATSLITGFDLVDATGFATSTQVVGQVFAADMASPTPENLTLAVEDMMTAYTDAAGRPTPNFLELATGNIGGKTLTPGLYKWTTTVTIPSDVVISGGADDIWIFQISGDLSMSSAMNITLAGGAQAKNIFWQVAGSVTVGTNASFQGIILSMNDIIFQTEATLFGRALAQKAVILDQNTVTKPE